MKLFEQDWSNIDLDDIPLDGTVLVGKQTRNVSIQKVDTKKADTKKADTKKADTKKADTKKWTNAAINDYKRQLISNAIIFYEVMNKQLIGVDIDEDAIWKSIKKYMLGSGGNDAQLKTAYCDIIIRILNSNSLQAYVKKYPKQYEYFISRNGTSGTTIDFLKSINNTYLRRLDNLFVGTLGDWLDFDTEALIDNQSTSVRRKKLNYTIFNGYKYNPNQQAKVPLKLRYTDSEINSKILSFYKNNVFGVPKEQFK
jgi:hypothetical protein